MVHLPDAGVAGPTARPDLHKAPVAGHAGRDPDLPTRKHRCFAQPASQSYLTRGYLVRPSPCLPRQGTACIFVAALDDPGSPFATMFCGSPVRLCGSTVPLPTRIHGVPRSHCLAYRPRTRHPVLAKIVTCARNTGGSLACCRPTDTGLATWGMLRPPHFGPRQGWIPERSRLAPARGHDFLETTRNGRDGTVTGA